MDESVDSYLYIMYIRGIYATSDIANIVDWNSKKFKIIFPPIKKSKMFIHVVCNVWDQGYAEIKHYKKKSFQTIHIK